ncbi:MAG: DUF5107 domain-containing protein [Actinocatenispora sp.]
MNPLPPVAERPPAPYRLVEESLPADIMRNARYGGVTTLMPYLMQDGYTRSRQPGGLRVAVLDNGVLRATFALELGGRLWSLVDLRTGRELLYRNPVLQPANLALRNAWFAGGVEWNIGTRGHSPTTCSPVHAARVAGPGGVPMLRLWEYERIRGTVFQVDAWLPEGAGALRVHVRVRNTTPDTVPVYWWSNTAVAEDVRVLAPAVRAFCTSYDGSVATRPVPVQDGTDRSYPARNRDAADYFFDTAGLVRPWIVAVDRTGAGLAQTSTARLAGRKLFVWGQSTGGRHWVDWLSPGNAGYAEIQAGLAATQYEHLPLPPDPAGWSWLETYGPVRLDPDLAHGDWTSACAHADAVLAGQLPAGSLDAELAEASALADVAPEESLSDGTGWGALERHRRAAGGLDWCDETGTPFDDRTIGDEQRAWLSLLSTGTLPDADPAGPPASYVGGAGSEADWSGRLAGLTGWLAAYHRAVLAHQLGDRAAAEAGYRESLAASGSPWALRGLAVLRRADGSAADSADLLVRAHRATPGHWQLAVEAADALLAADRAADCLALVDALPAGVREHGRIRLVEVRAALAAGGLDRARDILESGLTVDDMREGETSLDLLWEQAFGDRPVPARYDFRMHRRSGAAATVDGEHLAVDVRVGEQQHADRR